MIPEWPIYIHNSFKYDCTSDCLKECPFKKPTIASPETTPTEMFHASNSFNWTTEDGEPMDTHDPIPITFFGCLKYNLSNVFCR